MKNNKPLHGYICPSSRQSQRRDIRYSIEDIISGSLLHKITYKMLPFLLEI